MAAGILLTDSEGKVLLIKEARKGAVEKKYNFIGGKRECRPLDDWCNKLSRLETSFETASAEFEEETGAELLVREYQRVYWFPQSKFLLFSISVLEDDYCLDKNTRAENSSKWFTPAEIDDGIKAMQFHEHVCDQLYHLRMFM